MEYSIGDFSQISRLGIKTLRYYHEIGLLEPSRVDPYTGYRYYDEECLSRVRAISRLKDLNFSLGEIRDILAGKRKGTSILRLMQKKLTEVEGQLALMERSRERLAAFVKSESLPLLRAGPVSEKYVSEILIASIRFLGRYPEVGDVLPGLLEACGALASGPPFSLYHDDQPMEEEADIEACVPISAPFAAGGVNCGLLSGGRVISIIHPGIYDQLWVSYQALVDYMNRRGLEQAGPVREIYLERGGLGIAGGGSGSAGSLSMASTCITEIQFPVK